MPFGRTCAGAFIGVVLLASPVAGQGEPSRGTSARPDGTIVTDPPRAGPAGGALTGGALTGKERLAGKASDEQRVDNCKVPPEKRGPKPRPDACDR